MKPEEKSLRLGIVIIVAALLLRFFSGGLAEKALAFLSSEKLAAVLLYLETGRIIVPIPETTAPAEEPPPPTTPEEPVSLPVFAPEDSSFVEIHNTCSYTVDVQTLLQKPLAWELTGSEPTVLILHSHGSESYTKTENYTESSDYRTLNTAYNMISVGDRLAQLLEAGGIHVVHDRSIHDYPSYTDAYDQSRMSVKDYLKQYPSIQLVLDLHRDAVVDGSGKQMPFSVSTEYGKAAQMMLVVGTDAGGLPHPNWEDNMALALKLHVQLEQNCPDICRPINFRRSRFNQDLSAGALLIEMGAAGNNRHEALLSAEFLAQAILQLAHGTATTSSTS